MDLKDLLIPDYNHQIATEGLIFDSKVKQPRTVDVGGGYNWYGNTIGYHYPNDKYAAVTSERWNNTPESFNKLGESTMSKITAEINSGFEFAKKHQDELFDLVISNSRAEAVNDLWAQFIHNFDYTLQVNATIKKGISIWSGVPVPVNPNTKKKVIDLATKVGKIMDICAHVVKNGKVKYFEGKGFLHRDIKKTTWDRICMYLETYQFGNDFLVILNSAILE